MNRPICAPYHRHGESSTCYIAHRCGCGDCRAAHRARYHRRTKLKAYGRWDTGLVDVAPVRDHLHHLMVSGLGYKRIAALSGVSITAIRVVLYGRQQAGDRHGQQQRHIGRDTADRLLAVHVDITTLAAGARVSARGTRRRLQALVALGWTQSALAARLGLRPSNMPPLLNEREQVTVRFHRRVVDLFDELWNQLPPRETRTEQISYKRARAAASRRGWLPPLAWDDIDNDPTPPEAEAVDEHDASAVELAITGVVVQLTSRDREEAVRRLHARGHNDRAIAAILRCADRTVLRIRGRLDLPAITEGAA